MRDEKKTKKELIEELAALRRRADRAETIIAAFGDSIIIQDREYRVTYQNEVNRSRFGGHVGELCYRAYEGIDRICDECPIEETFLDGEVHRSLRSLTGPDGSTHHFELTSSPLRNGAGEIVEGIKVVRDVTGLVEAERRLAYSEAYLRSIIHNEPECVKLMDETGTVLEMNPAGLRMLEADDPGQVVGRCLMDYILDEHVDEMKRLSGQVCRGEPGTLVFRVRGLKGTVRWLETHAVPFEDAGGARTLILAVTRDISERRRAEEALLRAKEDLERQNEELRSLDRMKDGLIRDVSHELKTPVAKHKMQLEILAPLLGSERLTPGEQDLFRAMQENIRRQENVINNLLDLSRLESGGRVYRREQVRLDRLFNRVVEDNTYAADTCGARFDVSVPPVTIESDGEMLWHVFSNLIDNAVKFRRPGVPLRIAIDAGEEGDVVVVRITDNGTGLDEDALDRVFTRFYQGSPSTEGSGVGLAICLQITEELGGRIRLESPGPGRGTTATVSIPRPAGG